MQVGLLWFDSDPVRGVAAKAVEAARRYREKFGAVPDTCYVNQAALAGGELVVPLQPARQRGLAAAAGREHPAEPFLDRRREASRGGFASSD